MSTRTPRKKSPAKRTKPAAKKAVKKPAKKAVKKPKKAAKKAVKKAAKKAAKKAVKKAAKKTAKKAVKKPAKKTAKKAPAKKSRAIKKPSKRARVGKKPAKKRPPIKRLAPKQIATVLGKKEAADKGIQIIESPALMQAAAMAFRRSQATIGFVPTMGALHEAHMMLMREARRRCDVLVASIFVNPKQFNNAQDLQTYPREIESDLLKCEAAGVDILLVPEVERMYPSGFDTTIQMGTLAQGLCGAHRPGHFDGMCTVVAKLFHLVRPHFAVFGEKDFQQLQIVRRMVRDLSIPVEILGLPVLREVDGLAMSSRNARLDRAHRVQATALISAIEAAQTAAEDGERRVDTLLDVARMELRKRPLVEEEYVEIVDPETLQPLKLLEKSARLLIAANLGEVRLIDNGGIFI